MMKTHEKTWLIRWVTNHGQGHMQSQQVSARTYEDALKRGEVIAKRRNNGVVTDVVLCDEEEE